MTYQVSRRSRLVTGTIIGLVVAFVILRPYSGRAKEVLFDSVFSACADANGLTKIEWVDNYGGGVFFDASARYLVPKDQRGDATVTCTLQWAGFLIGDDERDKRTGGRNGLRVIVSGGIYSPPEYNIDIQTFGVDQ